MRFRNRAWIGFSPHVAKKLKAVSNRPPEVITLKRWASNERPQIPGIDEEYDRAFCNRVVAYFRANREHRKPPPRHIRKKLRQKARTLRGWADSLSELNEKAVLLEARAAVAADEPVKEAVERLQEQIRSMSDHLDAAANQTAQGNRRQTRQTLEVLDHLVYLLHYYILQFRKDEDGQNTQPRSRKEKNQLREQTRELAQWLFRIADEDRPQSNDHVDEGVISSSIKQSLRHNMSDEDYTAFVHKTSINLLQGEGAAVE